MHYVISDIHGCFDELMALVKKIKLKDEDILYILGDAVDRGPKPVEVLKWMMMQSNVIPIIGNHEYVKEFSLYEELTIDGRRFVLVHTIDESIHSLKDLENADIYDLNEFLIFRPDFMGSWKGDDTFIIGHTPTWFLERKDNHIFKNDNLIDIDCGCVMGGNLAALCLETMEEFYVKG